MPVKGLYEQVINELLQTEIGEAERENLKVLTKSLDPGDSHFHLARYLRELIEQALEAFPEDGRLENQLALVNRLISLLVEGLPHRKLEGTSHVVRADLLLGIVNDEPKRPNSPLSSHCLLTGSKHEPTLVSELANELTSADSLDILCSFIKWSGVRILEDEFRQLAALGRPIRVITTCYMGVTEIRAVEYLRQLPGCQVKISYDYRSTRLHAKAYLVHRNTGFSAAYVGSSNLSRAAFTEGLEWNIKMSQKESPHLWQKICAMFETYWNDDDFELYDDTSKARLVEALKSASSPGSPQYGPGLPGLDLRPYPFQQEILDRLTSERELHNRHKNLVVAATGTGKTLIAAFDYRRTRDRETGKLPRLLFVAHREEILQQSLWRFRAVLKDYNFGELWVGGFEPTRFEHLFVSIQTLNSTRLWEKFSPDNFEYVVVDEFHRAAAPTYQQFLDWVKPRILLGLTATPERMDQLDVVQYFDGHIAAEIRLPDAIDRKLLSPFQYFGITDAVDYSTLRWQRGRYAQEDLEHLITGNDIRATLIIDKVRNILLDPLRSRGIGFCVSIDHANYMAKFFSKNGIPAKALTSETPELERRSVHNELRSRTINFVFAVDIFNEGVDIPEVDTVLFLRPTESLTVYIQQLGRGLRLNEDKDCLTVLDFVGHAHRSFNFEARFRAMLRWGSGKVAKEIKAGFPHLPSGCVINLEPIARQHILENIQQAIGSRQDRLVQRIREFEQESGLALSLGNFIEYHNLELDQIYRRSSWSRLVALAGKREEFKDPDEERLKDGLRRIAGANAPHFLKHSLALLQEYIPADFTGSMSVEDQRILTMMHYILWGKAWPEGSVKESLTALRRNPALYQELLELLDLRLDSADAAPDIDKAELPPDCPLELHCSYSLQEILSALGISTVQNKHEVREGAVYRDDLKADLFFVTLNKTEGDYSPTTMYQDYAISDELFHWQSQSTTSDKSRTGQRYIHHREQGVNIFIFVREEKKSGTLTVPYTFLGPVEYVSHQGSRPISIVWKLRHRLPARLIPATRQLVVG